MKKALSKQRKTLSKKKVQEPHPAMTVESSHAQCPECHATISLEGGEIGDYLECETCFAEFTIASLQPPRLEMVDEEK